MQPITGLGAEAVEAHLGTTVATSLTFTSEFRTSSMYAFLVIANVPIRTVFVGLALGAIDAVEVGRSTLARTSAGHLQAEARPSAASGHGHAVGVLLTGAATARDPIRVADASIIRATAVFVSAAEVADVAIAARDAISGVADMPKRAVIIS